MRNSIAAAICLLAATAQAHEGTYIGAGGIRCGLWTIRMNSPATKVEQEGWVFGYLSGINALSSSDLLAKVDGTAVISWVDKYCSANPNKTLVEASNELLYLLKDGSRK